MAENSNNPEPVIEGAQQRIRIKIRAYDSKIIDQTARKIIEAAERTGVEVAGPIPLPTSRSRYTVNRSPFIDKDSRDQFEMRVHRRIIDIKNPLPKTIDALMNLNLPTGVDIDLT